MNTEIRKSGPTLIFILPLIVLCVLIGIIAILLFSSGVVHAMLFGPKVVLSVQSPDGNYEAYVEEVPSFDPPNQLLLVERSNKTHFMYIAHLAGDVDYIKQMFWSPDSNIVVFHSKDYLTATRVSDWKTIRIYLGKEWIRSKPRRHHTTFSSREINLEVEKVEFPEAGTFSYRLVGDDRSHAIRMDSQVQN